MALTNATTRGPEPSDATAIAETDAEGLTTGPATFRDTPQDWNSFSACFMTGRGLALIALEDDTSAAWAGISPTSIRMVYQGVGEASIYVSTTRQGRGLGRRLLGDLVLASESAGHWTLVTQTFPENEASLVLHTALGFRVVGTRRKLGKISSGPFASRWRDVVMLERRSEVVG